MRRIWYYAAPWLMVATVIAAFALAGAIEGGWR